MSSCEIINELPSSAVLRKDQAHFTEPSEPARGLNTTNENQNLLYQAIRPSIKIYFTKPSARQADDWRSILLPLDGANDQSNFDEFGLAFHTI